MAFDVITPVNMGRGEIGLTLTTFRLTPNDSVDIVKNIDIANNGAGVSVVSVYLVPSGGSANDANILFPSVSIARNGMLQWTGVQVMDVGDTIQAISSIADVTMHVSGGNAI